MKRQIAIVVASCVFGGSALADEDLGQLSRNRFDPNSVSNPFGAGNPFDPNSVKNPYGQYGSPYSNRSATNPYATDAPKLYDSEGNFRGKLSSNPYDPDSISNPYGRYGNPYSPDSINNPYGAGNPYKSDSPNNPYGRGLSIRGSTDDATIKPIAPRTNPYSQPNPYALPEVNRFRPIPSPRADESRRSGYEPYRAPTRETSPRSSAYRYLFDQPTGGE